MPRLYLIRHAEPSGTFSTEMDPGLSDLGQRQARAVAGQVSQVAAGKLELISSPLRRAQETAKPLAALWATEPLIDRRFAEIPSPFDDPAQRGAWLQSVLPSQYSALPPELGAWRDTLVAAAAGVQQDCVVFSHFIAINALVGAARGLDQVVVFRPAHCSVTVLESVSGSLKVLELGGEAASIVT